MPQSREDLEESLLRVVAVEALESLSAQLVDDLLDALFEGLEALFVAPVERVESFLFVGARNMLWKL